MILKDTELNDLVLEGDEKSLIAMNIRTATFDPELRTDLNATNVLRFKV